MTTRTLVTFIVAATLATGALADNVIDILPNPIYQQPAAPKVGDFYITNLPSGPVMTTIDTVFDDNSYTTTIEVFPNSTGKVNGKTWTKYSQIQLVNCNNYAYTVLGGVYFNNAETVHMFNNATGKTFKIRSSLADNTDASVRIRSFCNAVNQ